MKTKNKTLIIVAVSLLTMAFLFPVYAQTQNGIMQQDRDQDCDPAGPATRAYGDNAQNPEEDLTVTEETSEQPGECNCQNEDCQQFQYQNQHQHQYQYQYQYRYGQEEQD